MASKSNSRRLSFERLESRRVFSLSFDIAAMLAEDIGHLSADQLSAAEAKGGGGGKGGKVAGPEIDLPTVVAHELGHSLGLEHSTDPSCGTLSQPIMCPYYIGSAFRLATEDISKIRTLYPDNSVVANSLDDRWDNPNISFSFMPDGTSIDQGGRKGSELFSVMQKAIGSDWQSVFQQALNLWAEATDAQNIPDQDSADNALKFTEVSDNGSSFNTTGASQGDARFGDVRFGSHKFDGPGGVLAHAYFPPPNGATAAGDAHFAKEENWKNLSGLALSPAAAPSSGSGNLTTEYGRSAHLEGSARIRHSERQLAGNLSGAPFAAATWSIGQASFHATETRGVTATAADKLAGWRDRLEMQRTEQPQWASSSLTSASGSTEPVTAISKDTSRDDDLLAAWDEVLLNWPVAEATLVDILHVAAT